MSEKRPNGEPPNLRFISTTCADCRHGEHGYEGEIECRKFPVRVEYEDPEEAWTYNPSVSWTNVCDAHEKIEGASDEA